MGKYIALDRGNPGAYFHDIEIILKSCPSTSEIKISYYNLSLKSRSVNKSVTFEYKGTRFNIGFVKIISQLNWAEKIYLLSIGFLKTTALLFSIAVKLRKHRIKFLGVDLTESVISRINRGSISSDKRRIKNPFSNIRQCYLVLLRHLVLIYFCNRQNLKEVTAIVVMDWHYEERALVRALQNEVPYIFWAPHSKQYELRFLKNKGSPYYIVKTDNCKNYDPKIVEQYLENRLMGSKSALYNNKQQKSLDIEYSNPTTISTELTTAVFYLHSFVDGFADSRFDGFWTQTDYILYSLRQILKNEAYKNIYLKPHPLTRLLKLDVESLENLRKEIYRNFGSRISYLSENYKIRDIGKHVCISHHGSVTEEAYFGGNPVITSAFGLSKNFSGFYSRWESPKELSQLLAFHPTELNTIEAMASRFNFYEYVFSYRLSGLITSVQYGDLLKAVLKHLRIDLEYAIQEPFITAEKINTFFTKSKDVQLFDLAIEIYEKETLIEG